MKWESKGDVVGCMLTVLVISRYMHPEMYMYVGIHYYYFEITVIKILIMHIKRNSTLILYHTGRKIIHNGGVLAGLG